MINLKELSSITGLKIEFLKSRIKKFNEYFNYPFKEVEYVVNRPWKTYVIEEVDLDNLHKEFFIPYVNGFKTCSTCEQIFAYYDVKDNHTICTDCRDIIYNEIRECKCGCGEKISGTRNYIHGHSHKDKTYLEIYGTENPGCGYQKGEANIAKQPEVRKIISEKISQLYIDDPLLRYTKFKKGRCNTTMYSKISQVLFWNIYNNLEEDQKKNIYFGELNKEFQKTDNLLHKGYYYDFVKTDTKQIIEFNGDIFHANPKIFNEDDCPNPFNKNQPAKEIWRSDNEKIKLVENLGFTVLVIWASDYDNNCEEITKKCIKFITGEDNEDNQKVQIRNRTHSTRCLF